MVYFDYAAATPVDEAALAVLCDTARRFPANPESAHPMGRAAGQRLDAAARQVAALTGAKPEEVIFTSGATESNNLAIQGAARQYQARGKHILTTWLEHSSVNGALAQLQQEGFEVEYIGLTKEGQIDLDSLRALLRRDTVLVSVCMVDSEVGLRQPVAEIKRILADYPDCVFHVDAAQAAGKLPVSLADADLVTLAPHKFYGPVGAGVLLRRETVLLAPLVRGGGSLSPFRSGTPALPLIAAGAAALSLAVEQMEERNAHVRALCDRLRAALADYDGVRVNSTAASVPHIFNFSVPGVRAEKLQQALAERGVCLSTKSACCAPGTPSRPVLALTGDRKRALSTLRVSLSHLTTDAELDVFLEQFADVYAGLRARR